MSLGLLKVIMLLLRPPLKVMMLLPPLFVVPFFFPLSFLFSVLSSFASSLSFFSVSEKNIEATKAGLECCQLNYLAFGFFFITTGLV